MKSHIQRVRGGWREGRGGMGEGGRERRDGGGREGRGGMGEERGEGGKG